jgi:hypothetical protein
MVVLENLHRAEDFSTSGAEIDDEKYDADFADVADFIDYLLVGSERDVFVAAKQCLNHEEKISYFLAGYNSVAGGNNDIDILDKGTIMLHALFDSRYDILMRVLICEELILRPTWMVEVEIALYQFIVMFNNHDKFDVTILKVISILQPFCSEGLVNAFSPVFAGMMRYARYDILLVFLSHYRKYFDFTYETDEVRVKAGIFIGRLLVERQNINRLNMGEWADIFTARGVIFSEDFLNKYF